MLIISVSHSQEGLRHHSDVLPSNSNTNHYTSSAWVYFAPSPEWINLLSPMPAMCLRFASQLSETKIVQGFQLNDSTRPPNQYITVKKAAFQDSFQ